MKIGDKVFLEGTVEGVYVWGVQARLRSGEVIRMDNQNLAAAPQTGKGPEPEHIRLLKTVREYFADQHGGHAINQVEEILIQRIDTLLAAPSPKQREGLREKSAALLNNRIHNGQIGERDWLLLRDEIASALASEIQPEPPVELVKAAWDAACSIVRGDKWTNDIGVEVPYPAIIQPESLKQLQEALDVRAATSSSARKQDEPIIVDPGDSRVDFISVPTWKAEIRKQALAEALKACERVQAMSMAECDELIPGWTNSEAGSEELCIAAIKRLAGGTGEQAPCFTCEGEQGLPATHAVMICEKCFGADDTMIESSYQPPAPPDSGEPRRCDYVFNANAPAWEQKRRCQKKMGHDGGHYWKLSDEPRGAEERKLP